MSRDSSTPLRFTQDHTIFGSLVRIDQAKTAFLAINQIDRDVVLTAAGGRKAGGGFLTGIVIVCGYLFAALIIDIDLDFFCQIRGSGRKPILIPGVQIYRNKSMIVRLDRATPVAIANLESIVRKCAGQIERCFARVDFCIGIGKAREIETQRQDRQPNW